MSLLTSSSMDSRLIASRSRSEIRSSGGPPSRAFSMVALDDPARADEGDEAEGDRDRGLLPDGAGLSPWPRPTTSLAARAMGMTGSTLLVWNSNPGSKAGLPANRSSEEELRQTLAANGIVAELFIGDNPEESRSRLRSAVKDGSRVRVDRSRPDPDSGARWHYLRRVGTSMAPSWGELLPVDGGRCLPTIGDLGVDVLAW